MGVKFQSNVSWGGSPHGSGSGSSGSSGSSGGHHGNNTVTSYTIQDNKPYIPTGGSDDYGIGSGGEFGGINYGSGLPGGGPAIPAYEPWVSSIENLPDNYTYTGDYVPYTTPWQENLADAMGGLSYDWVDPDSDFFKDEEGNIIGKPGEGLWDPLAGLSYDQMATMYDMGEYYGGPIFNYSGYGGGGGGGGWGYGGGYGGGGGGGGGGYIEQELPPQGNKGERWGAQTPWQQMMINTHAGKGFQQGYARGGIVGLVE